MARRQIAEPLPALIGDLPVREQRLDNGLRILVLPRPHSPIVVSDLYYPVGSALEAPSKTGISHFLEHMLFKGTRSYPKGELDHLTVTNAGDANAETDTDLTHYWFQFPRDRWELALDLEADRMRGALLDPSEVESERRVIAEERAADLDSPSARLDEQFLLHSYEKHPYRNPVLGWAEDLESITAKDLKRFYDRYYRPDYAVLVLAGDLDPGKAIDAAESRFGPIVGNQRSAISPRPNVSEPEQQVRRSFVVEPRDREAITRGLLGWHTVPRDHQDAPILGVLADILCCGRRSRLWDALVERDHLTTYVDATSNSSRLAGQFIVQLDAAPGTQPDRVEAVILNEIARIIEYGPTPEELSRSQRRLEAAWRWQKEDLGGLAAGLGSTALWGNWIDWPKSHRDAMVVTEADIRRVASDYLRPEGLTVGWSLPRRSRTEIVMLPVQDRVSGLMRLDSGSEPIRSTAIPSRRLGRTATIASASCVRLSNYRPRATVLENGFNVIYERHPGTGIVALELFIDADTSHELKPGVAALTGRLLEEGTLKRSAEELAETVEDIGGVLETGSNGVSLRIQVEDLPLGIELLADLGRRPRFPEDAFEWSKRKMIAELRGDRDEPSFRADLLFRSLIYGSHPYARDPRGGPGHVSRLTLDDLRMHHQRFFHANHATLVAVGDFDWRRLKSLVHRHFGDWSPSNEQLPTLTLPKRTGRPRIRRVDQPGEQVQLVVGHLGVERSHPDYEALTVLDQIFGSGPGLTDWLSRTLREELGLVYSVSGGMTESADRVAGLFRVALGAGVGEAPLASEIVEQQIRSLHQGEFSDEEVYRAIHFLQGSWVFDYQTVSQRADRLVELAYFGLPLDEPLQVPERLARLSPNEIRRVARRVINPEGLTRVEFGPYRPRGSKKASECA